MRVCCSLHASMLLVKQSLPFPATEWLGCNAKKRHSLDVLPCVNGMVLSKERAHLFCLESQVRREG